MGGAVFDGHFVVGTGALVGVFDGVGEGGAEGARGQRGVRVVRVSVKEISFFIV